MFDKLLEVLNVLHAGIKIKEETTPDKKYLFI